MEGKTYHSHRKINDIEGNKLSVNVIINSTGRDRPKLTMREVNMNLETWTYGLEGFSSSMRIPKLKPMCIFCHSFVEGAGGLT